MLAAGESGRFEFKRDADAIAPRLLASLANWVALDSSRDVAYLLVGVEEVEALDTGLVSGVPCGLAKGLDRAVARVQDVASRTRPIPVDVFIVEEGVGEAMPFLRVEVRPTMAPHFDDEGRRQTRQGRSTRALTDDELLRVYLDREAGSFAARFRNTAAELRGAVGAIGSQVDEIADAINHTIAEPLAELAETAEQAAVAASAAESVASTVGYDVNAVEDLLRDLQALVEELQDDSTSTAAAQVARLRMRVWWDFTVDTWQRSSIRAERLAAGLHALLSSDIAIDHARSQWELHVWQDLLADRSEQRRGTGTLKWWHEATKRVRDLLDDPAYRAPELPDMRAEIRADLDRSLDDRTSMTSRFKALLAD